MHESGVPNPYRFKDNVKKSIVDEFIAEYDANPNSKWHIDKKFHNMSYDEQLELFEENLFSLLRFAYEKDMRVSLCRTKQKNIPLEFTELTIEVPNEYTNVINTLDDGTEDDDPLVEILLTIQKINKDAFIQIVDDFGNSRNRLVCAEVWVSFDDFRWASIGVESEVGERVETLYDHERLDNVVTDDMILDYDVCEAVEKILKRIYDSIKNDPEWYSWFILQGINIDEVFLWNLTY